MKTVPTNHAGRDALGASVTYPCINTGYFILLTDNKISPISEMGPRSFQYGRKARVVVAADDRK